jgi:hypothetical protein
MICVAIRSSQVVRTHDLCAKPFEAGRELLQNLTIEAASDESARGLSTALAEFRPRWRKDVEGRNLISVQLGNDGHVLAVFDVIHGYLAERAQDDPVSSLTVAVDGHRYSVHDR